MLYRVVDVREPAAGVEQNINAQTPEEAVRLSLGLDTVRSGRTALLVAKVYYHMPSGQFTVVRLYARSTADFGL